MTETTRRILLITGAGASASLGTAGEPVPQMREWAGTLAKDINQAVTGAADEIGIRADMPGDELETNLGQFLAYDRLLPLAGKLGRIAWSYTDDDGRPELDQQHKVPEWLDLAQALNRAILEAIRANLFHSFGPRRIDTVRARTAYQTLFTRLGNPYSLAIATTNYDHGIERGLNGWTAEDGRQIFTSDRFSAPYEGGTKTLEPTEVSAMYEEFDQGARGNVLRVPLIHLHGAVGWYLDEATGLISQPHALDQPYQPGRAPALLLPDSEKTAYSLPGGDQLWNQFRLIANDASHILFLGHSLHDRHILRVINDTPRPKKIAVFWRLDEGRGDISNDDQRYIERTCPGAQIISGEFGPDLRYNEDQWQSWLQPA